MIYLDVLQLLALMGVKSKLTILFGLYFLQGLPYGFQIKFLPLLLRDRNFSLSKIGLSRLLSLPWLLKPAIAPLVDGYGSLNSWITICLSGIAATYTIPALVGAQNTSVILCSVLCLNINMLASVQDIAVDALTIRLLKAEDLGRGNAAQVVGYKFGALFGGGILVWLTGYTGWEFSFAILAIVYLQTATCSHLFNNLIDAGHSHCNGKQFDVNQEPVLENSERSNLRTGGNHIVENDYAETNSDKAFHRHQPIKTQTDSESLRETSGQDIPSTLPKTRNILKGTLHEIMAEYRSVYYRIWKTPGFGWLALYVLFYKLGEQGLISMFPLFLVDSGFPASTTGVISGIFGQVCSIAGSALGGWFINFNVRFGPREVLLGASVLRLMPMTLQWLLVMQEIQYVLALASECALQFFAGVITVATFTLMMHNSRSSPIKCQATHFSTLATIEVLGKLTMISVSGVAVDIVGYFTFFAVCVFLSSIVIIILQFSPKTLLVTKKELE